MANIEVEHTCRTNILFKNHRSDQVSLECAARIAIVCLLAKPSGMDAVYTGRTVIFAQCSLCQPPLEQNNLCQEKLHFADITVSTPGHSSQQSCVCQELHLYAPLSTIALPVQDYRVGMNVNIRYMPYIP